MDFTFAATYASTKDLDGSNWDLKRKYKWMIEECSKRDGVDYSSKYKEGVAFLKENWPKFLEYRKNILNS